MLSVYENPRTGHTFRVEKIGEEFAIVERDYFGELFQVLAAYDSKARAQDLLDKTADVMGWGYFGRQATVAKRCWA